MVMELWSLSTYGKRLGELCKHHPSVNGIHLLPLFVTSIVSTSFSQCLIFIVIATSHWISCTVNAHFTVNRFLSLIQHHDSYLITYTASLMATDYAIHSKHLFKNVNVWKKVWHLWKAGWEWREPDLGNHFEYLYRIYTAFPFKRH